MAYWQWRYTVLVMTFWLSVTATMPATAQTQDLASLHYLTEQYSPVAWLQLEELGVDSRQYQEVWTLGSEEFCYAFNSQIDDALVQQFQQALDRVRQQADYPALLQQFGLSP